MFKSVIIVGGIVAGLLGFGTEKTYKVRSFKMDDIARITVIERDGKEHDYRFELDNNVGKLQYEITRHVFDL